jgi:hypothetical protein
MYSRLWAKMCGPFRRADSAQGTDKTKKSSKTAERGASAQDPTGFVTAHTDGVQDATHRKPRTLQRYHGGPNQERMAFMEAKSAMTARNLAVCAEQVSIFLTSGEYKTYSL